MSTATTASFIHPSDQRWARALASARHDVYATAGYVLADAETHGAEPTGFLVVEDDRVFLLPLLIRAVVGTGVGTGGAKDAVSPYGYPGIVVSDTGWNTPGFVDRCLLRLLGAARSGDICSVFVRVHPLLNVDLATIVECVELTHNGATVSLDLLVSEIAIWSAMRKGHNSAINKAARAGFEVVIGTAADHFDELAGVYEETLERLGQASNDEFDIERLRRFSLLDEAWIAVARFDGVAAGAYLFYECNGIVQLHLGGTRTGYMRTSPSNMLIHAVALWAKERGNEVAHLGGGVGGSTTDSLFRFKSGFSPRRHPYHTLRIVSDAARYETLVDARARFLGKPRDALLKSGFFPAYRALAPAVPSVDPR